MKTAQAFLEDVSVQVFTMSVTGSIYQYPFAAYNWQTSWRMAICYILCVRRSWSLRSF
jgi:hypothetical protein